MTGINQGFFLFLENAFLEKPQGAQIDPPAFLGLKRYIDLKYSLYFHQQYFKSFTVVWLELIMKDFKQY